MPFTEPRQVPREGSESTQGCNAISAARAMFSPDEMSGHPLYGRDGPSWKGELLKQSAHMGKWSDRYFVLKERKLW